MLDVDVVGKNKCLVFTDGKVIEGTWEKESEKAPFYLYNDNEKQIQLNPGQTWIEVVKPNTKISYDKGDMGDQWKITCNMQKKKLKANVKTGAWI